MLLDKLKDSNEVSSLDINRIDRSIVEQDINTIDKELKYNIYENFCKTYINEDLESYKIEQLKRIYEIGRQILNTYYITNQFTEGICENETILKIQYILSCILYTINDKQYRNNNNQNTTLSKKLTDTIKKAEKLGEDTRKQNVEIEEIKNEVKTIVTVIISIVLAVSVIPTAIAGIERIDPNYILPFLSSVILFGIIMIMFVYTIYQNKIKLSTWIILIISIITCLLLWGLSFYTNIESEPRNEVENEIKNESNSI